VYDRGMNLILAVEYGASYAKPPPAFYYFTFAAAALYFLFLRLRLKVRRKRAAKRPPDAT
jgi:hypothetical protein